ncbi:MAG: BREX-6 system BrxE protein [Myxococcota bacterium]
MSPLEVNPPRPSPKQRPPLPLSELDQALTAQFIVAWAGEVGEQRRLGWWRSDLLSEYGGIDFFQRLLPSTWKWAVLQAARETALRTDTSLRRQDHNPDRIISLFHLGVALDERLEERLLALKQSGKSPEQALPGLELLTDEWTPADFWDWVSLHGEVSTTSTPTGRRIKGELPEALAAQLRALVAGLNPPSDVYPLPHLLRTT